MLVIAKFNDLTGKRIDKVVVLGLNRKEKRPNNTYYYWNCVCDCGKEFVRERGSLLDKRSTNKSCGCFSQKRLSAMRKKHMMTETRIYGIYCGMKSRVTNPNNRKFKHYGGRGIKIYEDWLDDFTNFKNDMFESYENHVNLHGEKDTTLERIDVDGDYEPSNCKWATLKEQKNNQQVHKRRFEAINLTTGKKVIGTNQTEVAKILGITSHDVYKGLNGGRKTAKGFTFKYIDFSNEISK